MNDQTKEDRGVSLEDGPLSPDALLATTRSVRKRLDFDRPVERSLVDECLQLAMQAPTGSFGQGWGWVVVDDPDLKLRMAELYKAGQTDFLDVHPEQDRPAPSGRPQIRDSVNYLRDNLHRCPYLVVPTIDRSYGRTSTFAQASTWGSILPAAWSFMLALRARGLGSAWTTIHLHREQEMAELLGIPYPENTQAGLFPVAYTIGTKFSPADRSRSENRIFSNRWGVK
jgi:nitroreductase